MWSEEKWAKKLAEAKAQRGGPKRSGLRLPSPNDVTAELAMDQNDDEPEPADAAGEPAVAPGESTALTPEVVSPEGTQQGCPGCLNGEGQHRAADGKLRRGHTASGFGRRKGVLTSTRPAEEALRRAAPKAVATLIRCLDSDQPWIALTAARTICERVIPVTLDVDPDSDQPALVFPPGTRMAVLVGPEAGEAITAARLRVGEEG